MIAYTAGLYRFNYRVAGVAYHERRVLLVESPSGWFYLPGGRAEFGESAAETLAREAREELGVEATVGRLIWFCENHFRFDGTRYHELSLYFALDLPDAVTRRATDERFPSCDASVPETMVWVPLDRLGSVTIYPAFLRAALANPPDATTYIVNDERDRTARPTRWETASGDD